MSSDADGALQVGARVRASDAHPDGVVRMLNPHHRLAVLVAWTHGPLEWRATSDLTLLTPTLEDRYG